MYSEKNDIMMSKLSQTFSIAITTLGLSVVTSLTSQAIAREQPKCFMIEESGQFIDLSSLCDYQPQKKQSNPKKSSASIEQPTSNCYDSNPVPLISDNSVNPLPSSPLAFTASTPVAYINTPSSSTAYTSPTFLVRRFREPGFTSSNSINRARSILTILRQRLSFLELKKSVLIIKRYK